MMKSTAAIFAAASLLLAGGWTIVRAECAPSPRLFTPLVPRVAGQVWMATSWDALEPVPGVDLELSRTDSKRILRARSDARGYFDFGRPAAGDYWLHWSIEGFQGGSTRVVVMDSMPVRLLAIRLAISSDQGTCAFWCTTMEASVGPRRTAPECVVGE